MQPELPAEPADAASEFNSKFASDISTPVGQKSTFLNRSKH